MNANDNAVNEYCRKLITYKPCADAFNITANKLQETTGNILMQNTLKA